MRSKKKLLKIVSSNFKHMMRYDALTSLCTLQMHNNFHSDYRIADLFTYIIWTS